MRRNFEWRVDTGTNIALYWDISIGDTDSFNFVLSYFH